MPQGKNTPKPTKKPAPRSRGTPLRSSQLLFLICLGILLGAGIIIFSLYFLIGSWQPSKSSVNFLPQWLSHYFSFKEKEGEIVLLSETLKVPADNKTILTIEAKVVDSKNRPLSPSSPVQGEIKKGGGRLTKQEGQEKNVFHYQAGNQVGITILLFTADKLEKELALTLVDPNAPAPPTITRPQNGEAVANPYLTVEGKASPNVEVLIFVDDDLSAQTQANKNGTFSLPFPKPLPNGPHRLWAISRNLNQITSAQSNTVELRVEAKKPEIYREHIRTLPSRVKANTDFYLFLPTSLNTKEAYLLLNDREYKLRNPNLSGVFSKLLPSPPKAGNYSLSFYLVDEAGNKSYFNEAYTLRIY